MEQQRILVGETADVSLTGIDRSQLRRNLRLTPTELVEQMVQAARFLASIRGTARNSKHS